MALNIGGEVGDPMILIRNALKVLNSSTESAEKIRVVLDDLIKVRLLRSRQQ